MKKKYSVVGLLAREHGLDGLKHLIDSDRYDPVGVFTHRKRPTCEDSQRSEREGFQEYKQLTEENDIPLHTIDSRKGSRKFDRVLEHVEFDLIACISWRYLIPPHQLQNPRIGGINLHRGKLPEYAGAEPVARALRDGKSEVYITAHILDEKIDSGEVISVYRHPITHDPGCSLDDNVERIKKELTPHFGPLLIKALDAVVLDYERKQ